MDVSRMSYKASILSPRRLRETFSCVIFMHEYVSHQRAFHQMFLCTRDKQLAIKIDFVISRGSDLLPFPLCTFYFAKERFCSLPTHSTKRDLFFCQVLILIQSLLHQIFNFCRSFSVFRSNNVIIESSVCQNSNKKFSSLQSFEAELREAFLCGLK